MGKTIGLRVKSKQTNQQSKDVGSTSKQAKKGQ